MEILIFTHGNENIGFGHLSRCLTIAECFKERGWNVCFIIPNDCIFLERISKLQFELLILDSANVSYELKKILDNRLKGVLLLDVVEFMYKSLDWLAGYRSHFFLVTITLFLFEGLPRYEHLSFYPTLEKEVGVDNFIKPFKLVFGSKYFVIKGGFAEVDFPQRREGILVTMGGGDPINITSRVVQSLGGCGIPMTVILNAKAKHYNEVEKLISTFNSSINLIDYTEDLPMLASHHKIAIINGGLTRYEFSVMGIPFVQIAIHRKQYLISERLAELGIGLNIGIVDEISDDLIMKKVKEFYYNEEQLKIMSINMKSMFDTCGASRITDLVLDEFSLYNI